MNAIAAGGTGYIAGQKSGLDEVPSIVAGVVALAYNLAGLFQDKPKGRDHGSNSSVE